MPRTIIVNTSPIQYLHQPGLFHLLPKLFSRICVPEEVLDEIRTGKQEGIDLPDLRRLDYVDMAPFHCSVTLRLVPS